MNDVCCICNRKHNGGNLFVDTMLNLSIYNNYFLNTIRRLKLNPNLVLCSECLRAIMSHYVNIEYMKGDNEWTNS